MTKVGSALSKDLCEPSIFDLEDLQSLPQFGSQNSLETNNTLQGTNELDSRIIESSSDLSEEELSEYKNNNNSKKFQMR